MDSIKNLIQSRLKAHQLDESAEAATMIFQANQWMQTHHPQVAQWARATRFEEGQLTVSTEHASGAQAMWGIQKKLMAYLNEVHQNNRVRKIVIKGLTIQ